MSDTLPTCSMGTCRASVTQRYTDWTLIPQCSASFDGVIGPCRTNSTARNAISRFVMSMHLMYYIRTASTSHSVNFR